MTSAGLPYPQRGRAKPSHPAAKQDDDDPGARQIWRSTVLIGTITTTFGFLGVLAIWAWAAGTTHHATEAGFNIRSILGCDVLVAGASAAVGGLLGFVFGIPRTLDPASRIAVAAAASQNGPVANSQAALAANTNLERISDWFTTLLIGATLVQFRDVIGWIGGIGTDLSEGHISNAHVIPIVIVYYIALSFIGIYLITRLYLTYALQQTLLLLTGRDERPSIAVLKADLADALASGDPADLAGVSTALASWPFRESEAEDPRLNCNLARMFARLIASSPGADARDGRVASLWQAVDRASKVPAIKEQLASDVRDGRLSTGVTSVDDDLKKRFAS